MLVWRSSFCAKYRGFWNRTGLWAAWKLTRQKCDSINPLFTDVRKTKTDAMRLDEWRRCVSNMVARGSSFMAPRENTDGHNEFIKKALVLIIRRKASRYPHFQLFVVYFSAIPRAMIMSGAFRRQRGFWPSVCATDAELHGDRGRCRSWQSVD